MLWEFFSLKRWQRNRAYSCQKYIFSYSVNMAMAFYCLNLSNLHRAFSVKKHCNIVQIIYVGYHMCIKLLELCWHLDSSPLVHDSFFAEGLYRYGRRLPVLAKDWSSRKSQSIGRPFF